MIPNSAPGFEDFQNAMLDAAERMGGDALAHQFAEHLWATAIHHTMRTRAEVRHIRPHGYPGPHRGSWLRAEAFDFEIASRAAERRCAPRIACHYVHGEPFSFGVGEDEAWRIGPGAVVILITRTASCISLTEPGMSLAYANRHRPRSAHRSYSSVERAKQALRELTVELFATKRRGGDE